MDRISRGDPIFEISDLYYFYVVLGEDDPSVVEDFMGFSYDVSRQFFRSFLIEYLGTDDEARLAEVTEKASLLCYSRMIRKLRKGGEPSEENKLKISRCKDKLTELASRLDTLTF